MKYYLLIFGLTVIFSSVLPEIVTETIIVTLVVVFIALNIKESKS